MTGIMPEERELGRLVNLAVARGVPAETFGLGGMRSVGPAVTYNSAGYMVNGEHGVVLGRSYRVARQRIREIYAAWKVAALNSTEK